MKTHPIFVLATVALTVCLGAQAADEEAVKQELQALKGTWRLISREADGKKATDAGSGQTLVVYKREKK